MKECIRCSQPSEESEIGKALTYFVCDICRIDNRPWDVAHRPGGISYSIEAMEKEMINKQETDEEPFDVSE